MASYDLATEWWVDAAVVDVWEVIHHSELWTQWWPGLLSVVELDEGYDDGIANRRRYLWRGPLAYRLAFEIRVTRIERYTLLEGEASGDVSGIGRWRFHGESGGTARVCHEWHVEVNKPWMRRVAAFAHPVFRWNHDVVMWWGARGLARRIGRRVVCRRAR